MGLLNEKEVKAIAVITKTVMKTAGGDPADAVFLMAAASAFMIDITTRPGQEHALGALKAFVTTVEDLVRRPRTSAWTKDLNEAKRKGRMQ